jgi:hypothetical protein
MTATRCTTLGGDRRWKCATCGASVECNRKAESRIVQASVSAGRLADFPREIRPKQSIGETPDTQIATYV